MIHDIFAQEDLEEALAMVEKQQREWKNITGLDQNKFQARNLMAGRMEFTQAQFNALLWAWGQ
jgi:hypothetical protein